MKKLDEIITKAIYDLPTADVRGEMTRDEFAEYFREAMDKYAEYAANKAYRAGQISGVDAEHGLAYKKFDEWFKEFKVKENE